MDNLFPFVVAAGTFLAMLALLGGAALAAARPPGPEAEGPPTGGKRPAPGARLVAALGRLAQPGDPGQQDELRLWLVQAGISSRRSLTIYLGARAGLAMVLPLVAWMSWQPGDRMMVVGELLAAVTLGYYLPRVYVGMRRDRRQHRMRAAFPNALDMLVSCLEAGLGMDVALRHVASELAAVAPELCRELSLVNTELAAGVRRADALQHLHQRTGLEEVGSLVNELSQAERYGSRIAQALRAHAQHTRTRRVLESERKAAEATPKLTVVMIMFVLPPLFIAVLGPTAVTLLDRFHPTMAAR